MSVLLSVVIPSYNGARTIKETLQSLCLEIKNKKYENLIEIVVTDDFSNDLTTEIVESYQSEYRFLHLFKNKKNLGMDGNFLQSMLNASGKYIWFCGQDDKFKSGALGSVIKILVSKKNVQNIYLDFSQYDEQKNKIV